MEKEGILDFGLERLKEQINELREALNEVCAASDGAEAAGEILVLSQCLDELIVQYMNYISVDKSAV